MDVVEAYGYVSKPLTDSGRFYAPGTSLGLGKGCIFRDAPYPVFDPDTSLYLTVAGPVYVLTHECDVDADNRRLFNEAVLICPLTPLEDIVAELSLVVQDEVLRGFLANLGARNVSRLTYMPPIQGLLPYGSVMNLNLISNCTVDSFQDMTKLECAVTAFGLQAIEYMLDNHLLRPKADRLAFTPPEPGILPVGDQDC